MAKKTDKSKKAKAAVRKPVVVAKTHAKAPKAELAPKAKPTKAIVAETSSKQPEGKKLSSKLLEAIEKRQNAKAEGQGKPSPFGRPMGRRGRRPKRLAEYTPSNGEENSSDQMENENQMEGLEYDTGIRLKEVKNEDMFSMDRFEDYDEELNFDR